MNWIKKRVNSGQVLAGTFLNLGVGCAAEIAGRAGLDWILIDMEHGLGGDGTLVSYLQAARVGGICPIVRIVANRCEYFKRALDLGAAGIMVPQVNTPQEAEYAVQCMKYPPEGIRGMTRSSWAGGFGLEGAQYIAEANENVLAVVQIETQDAVRNVEEIAAVAGVDVLFVGPSDLSCNLGIPCDLKHPQLRECLVSVMQAAKKHGKKTGILIKSADFLPAVVADGFTLIAMGTDLTLLTGGLKKIADSFESHRESGKG